MRTRLTTYLLGWTTASLAVWSLALPTDYACAQNKFVMDENNFNAWLYQGNRQAPDQESETTLMVEAIDRSCHLTAEQKEKLRLGGQGDYARFEQKVNDLRSECIGKSYDQN